MATLKEFEDALRDRGMVNALAILDELKKRDRARRSIAPARRVVGRKMTAELARSILDLHATTGMTQQEIAFKLGVNQGRVNEVIKRGKWLNSNPAAPEALSRDKAMQRLDQRARSRREPQAPTVPVALEPMLPVVTPMAQPHERTVDRDGPKSVVGGTSRPTPIASKAPSSKTMAAPTAAPEVLAPRTSAPGVRTAKVARELLPPKPRIISAQLAFLDL